MSTQCIERQNFPRVSFVVILQNTFQLFYRMYLWKSIRLHESTQCIQRQNFPRVSFVVILQNTFYIEYILYRIHSIQNTFYIKYILQNDQPPKNGEIALQSPRTEFWRVGQYGYSTNCAARMKLLTLLVEIIQSTMLVHLNLNIQVTKILYQWLLLLHSFRFCETYLTTHPRFVASTSAISPFLGGIHAVECLVCTAYCIWNVIPSVSNLKP